MRRTLVPIALTAALLLAGCSSDGSDASDASTDPKVTTTTAAETTPVGADGHECDLGASIDDLEVVPVDGTPSDYTMTSADGTKIRLHWFPVEGASADEPAPTILMGPGWSQPGDVSTDGAALFKALSISGMWDEGYNVLTWDPRGFGKSEGVATVNDPEKEGKDAQALLDFVAAQPEAQLDDEGDPRVGMAGFSYGGGIQLTLAGLDCRVDAIAPGIAWHSLETSLYKAETVKTGWSTILTSSVPKDRLDPHIVSASEAGLANQQLSEEDLQWFIDRGPGDELVGQIDVPTLLIGGTVDTLFTLDEDLTNFGLLQGNEVPTSMIWFCGGHGTCLTEAGDEERVANSTFAWFDRYLKGDTSAAELPTLDLVDQDGDVWTSDTWPVDPSGELTATGSGTLELTTDSHAGGGELDTDAEDPLAGIVTNITPTPADVALEVSIPNDEAKGLALGAPMLTMTYTGSLPEGESDGRVFAQLVDDDAGLVIGNQITPIALQLDGEEHTIEVPLEVIAHDLSSTSTITLQLVATTSAYAVPSLGGELDVSDLKISLPIAGDAVKEQ